MSRDSNVASKLALALFEELAAVAKYRKDPTAALEYLSPSLHLRI